jgi:anti-sigma factor RsiW
VKVKEPMKIDKIIEQYLDSELSPDQVESFEDSFFRDDAIFEQLQVVVAEYLDAYLEGTLSPQQKAMVERKLLCSSENRELLNTIELIRAHDKHELMSNPRFSAAA